MSMTMRQGGDSKPTMTMKVARPRAALPLYIQVLGFTGNLQWFAECTMHRALKLL